jgi:hypothetical protein
MHTMSNFKQKENEKSRSKARFSCTKLAADLRRLYTEFLSSCLGVYFYWDTDEHRLTQIFLLFVFIRVRSPCLSVSNYAADLRGYAQIFNLFFVFTLVIFYGTRICTDEHGFFLIFIPMKDYLSWYYHKPCV